MLAADVDGTERLLQFQCSIRDDGQVGSGLNQPGRFEFEIQPFYDRRSSRLGVRERVSNFHLVQRGDSIAPQNIFRE